MKMKCLAVGIILLFVGTCIIPAIAQNSDISQSASKGNTIYVDDDNIEGPWDGTDEHPYRYIKDGVNASKDYDTVFVHNGLYTESDIQITKSIIVQGESRDNTILQYDGNWKHFSGFTLRAKGIEIRELTIRNYFYPGNGVFGIWIYSENNTIIGNRIYGCLVGIYLVSSHNIIQGNYITSNYGGIESWSSNVNTIIGNDISSNGDGILFYYGIWAGSFKLFQPRSTVTKNNIYSNSNDIRFYNVINFRLKNNYWGSPFVTYKIFKGEIVVEGFAPGSATTYVIKKIDWHPAREPFDISGMR
jgi:parallel beta-helix repeat protein